MQSDRDFMTDMAEFDLFPERRLWRAEFPLSAEGDGDAVVFTVPFRAYRLDGDLRPDSDQAVRTHLLRVEALENGSLRLGIAFSDDAPARETPMLNPQGIPPDFCPYASHAMRWGAYEVFLWKTGDRNRVRPGRIVMSLDGAAAPSRTLE